MARRRRMRYSHARGVRTLTIYRLSASSGYQVLPLPHPILTNGSFQYQHNTTSGTTKFACCRYATPTPPRGLWAAFNTPAISISGCSFCPVSERAVRGERRPALQFTDTGYHLAIHCGLTNNRVHISFQSSTDRSRSCTRIVGELDFLKFAHDPSIPSSDVDRRTMNSGQKLREGAGGRKARNTMQHREMWQSRRNEPLSSSRRQCRAIGGGATWYGCLPYGGRVGGRRGTATSPFVLARVQPPTALQHEKHVLHQHHFLELRGARALMSPPSPGENTPEPVLLHCFGRERELMSPTGLADVGLCVPTLPPDVWGRACDRRSSNPNCVIVDSEVLVSGSVVRTSFQDPGRRRLRRRHEDMRRVTDMKANNTR
ncbi:hypothetical protein C8T65DRAFT_20601 [Cerioporus squamosus]|nr:hypothetical protein C8T65DRAFT_20601 [Cerioporus squamosus]